MKRLLLSLTLLSGITTAAYADAPSITGAGSTFAAPIYSKWGEAVTASGGVKLNYQAVGSGAGINQINNRTVDFGASDMPVKPDDLATHKLFQFPTAIGGVVIIVNLPDVKTNTLKLTGPMLADIYLGKITMWNDKAIAELNPGMNLPKLAIAPVYRADGSGTTFVFTDYLSMMSGDWKSQVGSSTSVRWHAGTGAKGNDGISSTVHQVKGGLGYVESAYAEQNHLTTTQLQNHDGKFVLPSMIAYQAAAAGADWSKVQNFAIDLNDQPGAASWPIESATFVLLPMDAKDPAQTAAVKTFFGWAFDHGNELALKLQYVPLPDSVKDAIKKSW